MTTLTDPDMAHMSIRLSVVILEDCRRRRQKAAEMLASADADEREALLGIRCAADVLAPAAAARAQIHPRPEALV